MMAVTLREEPQSDLPEGFVSGLDSLPKDRDIFIPQNNIPLPETPSVINLDYKEPLPVENNTVPENEPVDVTYGQQTPLEMQADSENDLAPTEVPKNGTDFGVPDAVDVTYNQKSPFEQLADIENDTPPAEVPISGTEIATNVEAPAGLEEVAKLKEEVAELREQVRQLRELLENKNPELETVKAEVMPKEKPEPTPKSPKGMETIDVVAHEIEKVPDFSAGPVGIEDWGGAPIFAREGVGHDSAMAATEAFAEEAQKPEKKGFWERAKEKGSRGVGWILERAKGLGTFGYWEVRQAEKVRTAGREAQKSIVAGAEGLNQESGRLTHDDAWSEAEQMTNLKSEMTARGEMPEFASSRGFYESMSENISQEKKEANQELEDKMVADAIKKIEERLQGNKVGAGYRTFGGEAVLEGNKTLPEAKRREIEDKLRAGIGALRTSQLEADKIKFNKIVREGVDPNWYKRYVAGGIEAALWVGGGIAWTILSPDKLHYGVGAGKEAIKQVSRFAGEGNLAPTGSNFVSPPWQELIPQDTDPTKPLTSNLWNIAKQLFAEKGVPNPTDGQLMEVTKQLATDNATAVEKWGMAGKILDTKMPIGMAIKVAGAVAKIARLASGV